MAAEVVTEYRAILVDDARTRLVGVEPLVDCGERVSLLRSRETISAPCVGKPERQR